MATLKQIQFKRSKTAGARPAASVLAEGELAINLKDRTIFTKDDSGNIIDLGIAKGGQIDGNVTINGLLRLNGDYTQTGGMTVNGPIGSTEGVSALVFRSMRGSFYARATNDTSNAHLWFENTNGSERGVLYSKPQSENEGVITMRVRQGTAAGAQNSEFHFISTDGGIFQARKLTALTSISTPTISVNLINHDSKAFGQYDSQSLVQYVYPGTGETNGVNYLRKVRAKSGGTIYHEICTAQTGLADEMSWWTGNTPLFKLYGIRNDGRMIIRNSLAIGTVTEGYPSSDYGNTGVMGDRYLALGDNASGLKWVRTGVIDLMANGISAATIINNGINSTKKLMVGYSRDSGTTWDFPNNNQAMFTARTDIDGNNNGDGQTHIGYNSNSKMYHYFRGTGRMAVGMSQGLLVEPGILDINTGSNRVAIRADGTFDSTQRISMRTGLFLSGDDNTNALLFKAPSGVDGTKPISWAAGTRNGQNKNDISIKVWGNAFNSVPGIRETVFEVYDSQGYYFYSQRQRPEGSETVGPVVTQFSGQVNANGSISTAGNLKVDGLSTLNGNVTMKNGLFVQGGSSITGQVKIGGTADALRIWNAEYGAIFRRSESNLYIIPTPKGAGESGGISNLRPLIIELNTGTVKMSHDVHLGDSGSGTGLLQVSNSLKTIKMICPVTINERNAALTLDSPSSSSANYLQGSKAGTRSWYVGLGGAGNDLSLYSQSYGHGLVISDNFVSISKPLKVGNAQLGTDGNITNGSGNFANLNTTLNRKVNSGFITYGATAGWYKFATVTMPQSTSTVFFKIAGGSGFNSGLFTQCNIAEIVLRTSNERPADLNAVLYTRTSGLYSAAFRNIAVNNVSGNTYDIYVYAGTYCNQLACEWSCTENATVSVIGINSSTQSPVDALPDTAVNGQVANVLNNLVDRGKAKRYVAESEIAINNQTGIRITSNSDRSGSNSVLFRNDGGNFYILLTDKNSSDGDNKATEGDWNGKRPFSIDMTAGTVRLGENTSFDKDITINGNINSRVKAAGQWSVSFSAISDVTRDNSAFLANTGGISKTSQAYYPLFSGYSFLTDAGYRQSFEFGWLGVSGTWRQGIIRMRGDNASGQQARWTFDMDGTFYAPILSCGSARAFGVNTSNGLGGNSITFGDSDTGIKQNGDGLLDIYANNAQVFRFQNGDLYSYKNINAPNVYIRSDIRLKSNFKPIENALDKVEKLNGVIYDKAEYIGGEAIETEAGIVAQTLQDVLPEAVRETEDSKGNKILTVSSQAQIALLVEAVKTLSSRVKELESKLM
ncbi:long tail fiber protein distal subunit [Escherichia phage vB_EcoM-UFV13]|uniref:Long tail fiber protein Gp37 n=1 Tax=Escherichia phage vB_EcoM-UFV13 TaxID=1815590 RepID=A0A160CBG9_9CAUD|nr:long tail fiber protein distal subunit [Escherichia phage vB_EcoM-UFV13]ANA50277.1 tail fibers protein [Escherichia phage vB_EcoM-UFV13]